MGARSVGEEWPQVSSPRAKLKIGNELGSEGAKELIIRWAATEAGVQAYFDWSLSCGTAVRRSPMGGSVNPTLRVHSDLEILDSENASCLLFLNKYPSAGSC